VVFIDQKMYITEMNNESQNSKNRKEISALKNKYTEKNKHFEGVFHQYFEETYYSYSNKDSVVERKQLKRLKNCNQFFLT
jgi:hypothetical protein